MRTLFPIHAREAGGSPKHVLPVELRLGTNAHIVIEHPREDVDDLFAINAAKTEFRECFNVGDASRMLAIADPDLVSLSDGQPSELGASGLEALRTRLTNLFERFTAKLSVILIEIRLQGDVAYDYVRHDLTLTPKDGSPPIHRMGSLC